MILNFYSVFNQLKVVFSFFTIFFFFIYNFVDSVYFFFNVTEIKMRDDSWVKLFPFKFRDDRCVVQSVKRRIRITFPLISIEYVHVCIYKEYRRDICTRRLYDILRRIFGRFTNTTCICSFSRYRFSIVIDCNDDCKTLDAHLFIYLYLYIYFIVFFFSISNDCLFLSSKKNSWRRIAIIETCVASPFFIVFFWFVQNVWTFSTEH